MTDYGPHKKRKLIAAGVLMLIVILAVGCKTQEVVCNRTSNEIVIDGERDEWEGLPFNYFEDEDVVLGLSNDDENLYLFFSFKNQQWAQMIHMSGLNLWFDNEGKKNTDWGIRFKGGPEMSGEVMSGRERSGSGNDMPKPKTEFVIIDNVNYNELTVDTGGADGPAVSTAVINDIYTYEFRIPLSAVGDNLYRFAAAPGQEICIGSLWGGMDEEAKNAMSEKKGGGRGGMGGGGMGGGMRGGGMGGGRGGGMGGEPPGGGGREMPEEQEIWVKTVLATSAATTAEDSEN